MKSIFKKFLLACLAVTVCALPGCTSADSGAGDTESTPDSASNAVQETGPALESTWVGSYSTSNAMGDVVSGHLINFYDDGTVKIHFGIKAGMQGHHYGVYEGTYAEDGTVTYTYVKATDDSENEGTFTADLSADSFRAAVFCMANYPNSAAGGINYVRIDPVEPDMEAEYTYCGSKVTDDGVYASFIQIKDGVMNGSAAANGATVTFDGTYVINYSAVTDIDTPDMLVLSYAPLTVGENGITTDGSAVESSIEFNDTSYISYTMNTTDSSFPRIPMTAIVNQDGTYND